MYTSNKLTKPYLPRYLKIFESEFLKRFECKLQEKFLNSIFCTKLMYDIDLIFKHAFQKQLFTLFGTFDNNISIKL